MKNIWPLELNGLVSGFSLQQDCFDILLYYQQEMSRLSFFFEKGSVHGVIIWVEKCETYSHKLNFS